MKPTSNGAVRYCLNLVNAAYIDKTFQAQIEEILKNIEPALEKVFLKKSVY